MKNVKGNIIDFNEKVNEVKVYNVDRKESKNNEFRF
jgi:hypothetical protein